MIDSVAGVRCLVHGHTGGGHHFPRSREIQSRMFFYFYMVLLAFEVSFNAIFGTFDPIICDYSLPSTANNYTIIIT